MGISGVDDLVLTVISSLSRNHTLAENMGQGLSLNKCPPTGGALAEGMRISVPLNELTKVTKLKCRSATRFIKFYIKEYPAFRP